MPGSAGRRRPEEPVREGGQSEKTHELPRSSLCALHSRAELVTFRDELKLNGQLGAPKSLGRATWMYTCLTAEIAETAEGTNESGCENGGRNP